MSNNLVTKIRRQQELQGILNRNLNEGAATRALQLIVNILRNHPYSHNQILIREARRRLNNYNLGILSNTNSNSNSNNNVARRLNFNNVRNMNANNNFNWNSNGNLIKFPAQLNNNSESFTLNNFRPGQRYVQVTHGNTRSYFNLNSFKHMWQRGGRRNPLTRHNLTSNNLSIVRFKNKEKNTTFKNK
jgi:hypothetical protein